VEGRVAHVDGCRPFQSAGGALIGEGDAGFFCIDTSSPAWQYMVRTDFAAATSLSAHEYVHVLQAELGCLPTTQDRHYRWLLEGMASDIAWQALVRAGRVSEARVVRTIRKDRPLSSGLGPLRDYELQDGRDHEYALWHLAVRRLLRVAVGDDAVPASRPELGLRRFCERVGHGQQWHIAFARSFGLPLDRFYAGFEADRRTRNAIFR
jgi:hypothetical protein